MKWIFLVVVIVAALVGVLSHTSSGGSGPEFSIGELVLALLSIPAMIVSVIAVVIGVGGACFLKGQRVLLALIAGIGAVFPALMLLEKVEHESRFEASQAWCDRLSGAGQLNFYLHELMQDDVASISYLDDSELIDPRPIIERLKKHAPLYITDNSGRRRKLVIGSEGIETPWGAVIHFAVDRDGDGYITALGQRGSTKYGVSDPWLYDASYEYQRASGVLLRLPDKELENATSSIVSLDDNDYERLKENWRTNRK